MRIAGLISGTSVDAIDVAIVDITESDLDVVKSGSVPWPAEVRERILAISNATTHTGEIAYMNFLLGYSFANALQQVFPVDTVELIGSHGQTIYHQGAAPPCTLQIGDGALIAELTGRPVISDFRVADMAAGGRGAPLVPFLDYHLFGHPSIHRIALNIGGIANITVVPAGGLPQDVLAFDTGPGNMVMDALAPPFDRNGDQARAGSVNGRLLTELLDDPYYAQAPPKTAGREQYGAEFIARTGIDIATAAELTVHTIARAIAAYPQTAEVIVSGGGAHNRYLMERLQEQVRPRVLLSSEFGVDVDSKEAVLFAVLAYQTWHRRPGNLPSATGADHPAVLGKLAWPPP